MAGRAAAIKGILSANKELPQIKAAVERYRQDPKKFELELRGKQLAVISELAGETWGYGLRQGRTKRGADANPPYAIASAHQFYRGRDLNEEGVSASNWPAHQQERRIASALRRLSP